MRPRRDYVFLILIAIAAGAGGAGIAFFVANKNRVEVAIMSGKSCRIHSSRPPVGK